MSAELGALVDALHALLMAAWILGLPLLFWHRLPRLSAAYGVYAVVFVIATRASAYFLGECFLTTLARRFWASSSSSADTDEWFTVRFSRLVFGLTPSHRAIAYASEALVFVTAIGVLVSLHRLRRARAAPSLHPSPSR